MEKQLIVLKEELKKAIDNVENINQLNETKAKYLGKKSLLQDLMKMMPRLSVEERKNVGRSLNEFKNYAEELIARKAKELHDLKVRGSGWKRIKSTPPCREKICRRPKTFA